MANLELLTLVVRDYESALRFLDMLKFELVEDTPSLTNDGRPKTLRRRHANRAQTGILLARADGQTPGYCHRSSRAALALSAESKTSTRHTNEW